MPEETEKAMRGGLFHSGDTGKILDDGNLLITGRINTMVKINGNRVEPGEIEAALKKFAGIKNAVVKGFEHKRHQNYLCGYYVSEHEVPEAKLRSHLSRLLPHYMIPSFFMRLERIPLNINGKVDRFALPEPDVNRRTKTYAAPRTPEEETVCRAFEEILEVERVGIDDDFFELGGDSVTVAVLSGRLEDLQVMCTSAVRRRGSAVSFRRRGFWIWPASIAWRLQGINIRRRFRSFFMTRSCMIHGRPVRAILSE